MLIHPSAIVHPSATLGRGVRIGPFALIEEHVEIGDDCIIDAHAVIRSRVRMGCANHVHPCAVLGGLPQDLGFDPGTETWVSIGDANIFREGVTVNRATKPSEGTHIGSGCYLMNNSHIGHDCRVGNKVIMAANVALGGHVCVGDSVFFGGGAVVHQFCRVGSFAMIRGLAGINMDILPFSLAGGAPARHYKLNTVGLRRAGIDGDRYRALSNALRRLRKRDKAWLDSDLPTAELQLLREWLSQTSKRGLAGFVELSAANEE